jgi:CubicO group peptidase (beta-lactamase class C family)
MTTRRAFVLAGLGVLAGCASGGRRPIAEVVADAIPAGASGTVLAANGGEVVYCEGFGMADREADIACRCDTVYDIGSITKQFTATAILKLEQAGELAVTDKLRRFVAVPTDKDAITLHHLLTHTSGLPAVLGDDYDVLSRDDLLAGALAADLLSEPGRRYAYSNVGYSVLAAIVELVSGTGYEKFLAEHLFAPVGMRWTGYVLPDWDSRDVAVEYGERGERRGRPFDHPWDDDGPYWNLRGNGGVLSTARDMFRWHLALRGEKVLSSKAKRKLFARHVREEPAGDSWYGYGWVILSVEGARVVTHNGGNGMSYAEYTLLMDQDAMLFWATNNVRRNGRWDLEQADLTTRVGQRLLARRTD